MTLSTMRVFHSKVQYRWLEVSLERIMQCDCHKLSPVHYLRRNEEFGGIWATWSIERSWAWSFWLLREERIDFESSSEVFTLIFPSIIASKCKFSHNCGIHAYTKPIFLEGKQWESLDCRENMLEAIWKNYAHEPTLKWQAWCLKIVYPAGQVMKIGQDWNSIGSSSSCCIIFCFPT